MYKTTAITNVAGADRANAELQTVAQLTKLIKGGKRSKIYKGLQVHYKAATDGVEFYSFGDVWVEATTPEAAAWLRENKNRL